MLSLLRSDHVLEIAKIWQEQGLVCVLQVLYTKTVSLDKWDFYFLF